MGLPIKVTQVKLPLTVAKYKFKFNDTTFPLSETKTQKETGQIKLMCKERRDCMHHANNKTKGKGVFLPY